MVYSHVIKGENGSAKLFFGITYEELSEEKVQYWWRTKEIYYNFIVNDNSNIRGNVIERKIVNQLP